MTTVTAVQRDSSLCLSSTATHATFDPAASPVRGREVPWGTGAGPCLLDTAAAAAFPVSDIVDVVNAVGNVPVCDTRDVLERFQSDIGNLVSWEGGKTP